MNLHWKNSPIVILGLGQYPHGSGVTAAIFAAKAGARVLVSDFYYTKAMDANVKRLKKYPNVRFIFGKHPLDEIRKAELVIKHQRIRQSEPEIVEARKRGIAIETAESLFMKLCPCPIVGITGTRGKSTTTTLVAEMCKKSGRTVWLGGNILLSPLSFLSRIRPDHLVVLELSSFQLEGTGDANISPHVSCVTNLMRDHLNAYSGMDEYAEAKAQIFRHQTSTDAVVLNGDDAYGKQWSAEAPSRVFLFTKRKTAASSAWMTSSTLFMKDGTRVFELAQQQNLRVRGEHLYANMLAASLTAKAAGATLSGIRSALRTFRGLPHRQEVIRVVRGVTYINDTTATTPDGTIAAIRACTKKGTRLHLIIGGADKELEFEPLANELKRTNVDLVVLPGTAQEKLTRALRRSSVAYEHADDLRHAIDALRQRAVAGDTIILSPGCASFGQFQNEFDRGDVFRAIVNKIR